MSASEGSGTNTVRRASQRSTNARLSPDHTPSSPVTRTSGLPDTIVPAKDVFLSKSARKASVSRFWRRFTREGKKQIGVRESLIALATFSWLNIFFIFTPLAWVGHFVPKFGQEEIPSWSHSLTFTFAFLSIVAHENVFDFLGEQMAFYLGKALGDLLTVTLNNAVEATLAILLLAKCELKILQSTIVGVIVLHLLLVPGAAFITGGARIWEQDLHPHLTQLNQSLLTIGVLTLLLPAAFFAAIDGGVVTVAGAAASESVVNDSVRHTFLSMSRGLSVMLLAVYVCSRIFLHNPPGDGNALSQHPSAPQEVLHQELRLTTEDPEMNQWVCIAVLIVIVGIMASTAEWLVDSIEFVRKAGIQDEWFGLILLPIVSFSADGVVAITYFLRYTARDYFGTPSPPETLARARAIDLSIQFTLFWMPAVVLIGWWSNKPMSLLFDLFEVALLLGSCFLVNYVTADSKTNWLEGYAMVTFYLMIALCSWFYPGQTKIRDMVACTSVAAAVAGGVVEG